MRAVIFVDELGDEFDINLVSEVDITTIMGQPQFLFQPEKIFADVFVPWPNPGLSVYRRRLQRIGIRCFSFQNIAKFTCHAFEAADGSPIV